MTSKVGPKEQQLRQLREAMIKTTQKNDKLVKAKAKKVGRVTRAKIARHQAR